MKKRNRAQPITAFIVIMSMLLAACSSNPDNPIRRDLEASNHDEVVTLRLLVVETGTKWNIYPHSDIAKEIADRIGVKIEYVEADETKFNVLLAGGELPDIIRTEPATYGKQLIEGGLIIPMDDMLQEYGQDIMNNVPILVSYSKENWSEGRNQLYFLSPQIQAEPSPVYTPLTIGPTIRWDYYKEIGAPVINDPDDLLDVLEQIVQKHPQTEEGKRVYGVSMWQDWGLWPYIFPFAWYTTQSTHNSDLMARALEETQYRNILTDEESTFWVAMRFYNEANRKGLLDPDALTMKYYDYLSKATAGQIVVGPATWAMGDFNALNANDGKGYIVLPTGKYAWSGGINPLGWTGKSYAISKSSKHPEKAMQLLNYLYSYEGARTMYSGVEGKHWSMVDGKPQLKDETFQLKNAGGKEWEKTGINFDPNLIGLGPYVLDPVTSMPVDLFATSEALAKGMTALERDFSEYYGSMHPGDVLGKRIAEGKLIDANTVSSSLTMEQLMMEGKIGLPSIPEDMLKVEAQLNELAIRHAARLIMAKTDEEFLRAKQEALNAFKEAGVDKFTEFYTTDYAQRRAALEAPEKKPNH